MRAVLIVSKCLRVSKVNQDENCYFFHFKGSFAGEVLSSIKLFGNPSLGLQKNQEYLIYSQFIKCEQGVLIGKIIKIKTLNECYDQS